MEAAFRVHPSWRGCLPEVLDQAAEVRGSWGPEMPQLSSRLAMHSERRAISGLSHPAPRATPRALRSM